MICVNSVSVSPKEITLKVDTWYYGASVKVQPTNADCTDIIWKSDNPNVATVNASSGYIYGKAVGNTRISATATDGSNYSDYIDVNVVHTICVDSISLNHTDITLEKDKTVTLTATVLPENASNKELEWVSNNNSVATVNDGIVTAIANGTATITAIAKDGSDERARCTVNVTGDVLATSVVISPSSLTLEKEQSAALNATVYPSNATNKNVKWIIENNTHVARVNSNSGIVTALYPGTTTISAKAQDGSNIKGDCTLTVKCPTTVSSITISPSSLSMEPGDTKTLIARIEPSEVTNQTVIWVSNNPKVAKVGTRTGFVEAISDGKATITATTSDGELSASCVIVVDSREKVIVKKDSHSFYVEFADGKIWKGIGIDLSNRQDNYSTLYPPDFEYNYYDYLIEEEQRFLDNYRNFYSEKQFALLYLLDPFGVEYYLSQYDTTKYAKQFPQNFEDFNDKLRKYLKFKDRIYKEIFGKSPSPFVLSNDGSRVNITGSYDRIDVFTDAELIFGAHNIVDMIDLLERAVDLIIELVDIILPDTTKNKWIMRGVNVAKTLLFTGSIVEALSEAASDFLDDYIEDSSNGKIEIMEWPNPLLDNIYNFKKGIDEILNLPNIHDIKICEKVNKQSYYNVEFSNGSSEMFVGEIIALCS